MGGLLRRPVRVIPLVPNVVIVGEARPVKVDGALPGNVPGALDDPGHQFMEALIICIEGRDVAVADALYEFRRVPDEPEIGLDGPLLPLTHEPGLPPPGDSLFEVRTVPLDHLPIEVGMELIRDAARGLRTLKDLFEGQEGWDHIGFDVDESGALTLRLRPYPPEDLGVVPPVPRGGVVDEGEPEPLPRAVRLHPGVRLFLPRDADRAFGP